MNITQNWTLCCRLAAQCKAVDKLHDLCATCTLLKMCNACIHTFLYRLCIGVFHLPGDLTLFLWLQKGKRHPMGEFKKRKHSFELKAQTGKYMTSIAQEFISKGLADEIFRNKYNVH